MALISRISRLFKADFHAVLDAIEEPDVLLKQSIREMHDCLAHTQGEIGQEIIKKTHLNRKIETLEQSILKLQEEIELCLSSENEALARNLVHKKLCLIQQNALMGSQLEQVVDAIKHLKNLEQEHSIILTEMQQKAAMALQTDACVSSAEVKSDYTISESDIDVALLKEKQRFSDSRSQSQGSHHEA